MHLVKKSQAILISAMISTAFIPSAQAAPSIICKAPKKVMATVGYEVNCTSKVDIDGANAQLQYEDGSGGWANANQGEEVWSGTGITFNRIYSKPKTDAISFFRVVTDPIDGGSKKIFSNSFEVRVVPFKKAVQKAPAVAPKNNSTPQSVRIPNFLGMSVEWIQMNRNAYPGVKYMITGSSCAVSDVLSGAAVIDSQNPGPMQIRPYNTLVILGTNC
ncbi:unannotated protein [freshwater metagenome]|uniref:Unannotated protein n=1 Tax=freshwater metagenome TaxID=449393 RepID=A0A6J5YP87_9ZZZZ